MSQQITLKNFYQKLMFGQDGEKQVAEYLINIEKRNKVLPLFQFSYGSSSPFISSIEGEIIAPDFLILDRGKYSYAESKRKQKWVLYNKNTARETGLDVKLWKEYMRLVRSTGAPIELYFLHEIEEPIGLYRIIITEELLQQAAQDPLFRFDDILVGGKSVGRLIFFPYEMLEKLY